MYVFDKQEGMACDIAEFWDVGGESGKETRVDMSIGESGDTIEFTFEGMNLVVPIDRLKKLLGR